MIKSRSFQENRLLILALSRIAEASADHAAPAGSDQSTTVVLSLIVMVAIAYLLAHFVVGYLQKRMTFVSGAEYIILGIGLAAVGFYRSRSATPPPWSLPLAGPARPWSPHRHPKNAGSAQLRKPRCRGRQPLHHSHCHRGQRSPVLCDVRLHRLPLGQRRGHRLHCRHGLHGAIDVIQKRFPNIQTRILPTLSGASSVGNVIAVTSFTIAVCSFHSDATGTLEASASTWGWITIGIGLGLGVLVSAFFSGDSNENSKVPCGHGHHLLWRGRLTTSTSRLWGFWPSWVWFWPAQHTVTS